MNIPEQTEVKAPIDERYLTDWSGLKVGYPSEVLRPATTEEVAAIVRQCQRDGRRITVQGGLSGVAGGAVPSDGDVVINLERMNQIEDIDTLEGVMQVQAVRSEAMQRPTQAVYAFCAMAQCGTRCLALRQCCRTAP
jgi:FAD/FMN-containing dehydrogenase